MAAIGMIAFDAGVAPSVGAPTTRNSLGAAPSDVRFRGSPASLRLAPNWRLPTTLWQPVKLEHARASNPAATPFRKRSIDMSHLLRETPTIHHSLLIEQPKLHAEHIAIP